MIDKYVRKFKVKNYVDDDEKCLRINCIIICIYCAERICLIYLYFIIARTLSLILLLTFDIKSTINRFY